MIPRTVPPQTDDHRTTVSRLLATQQELIDLRGRLDREHRIFDAFLRFNQRALSITDFSAFWELSVEQIVETFDCEGSLVLEVAGDAVALRGTCGLGDPAPGELTALAAWAGVGVPFVSDEALGGFTLAKRPLAALLVASFPDLHTGSRFVFLSLVTAAKRAFYPSFDASWGASYATFVHQIALIQQNLRSRAVIAAQNQSLELRVAERTAELVGRNEELVRAASLKSDFIATMSHELRTPLNAILAFCETLTEEVYGPVTPRQRAAIGTMEGSGRHLLALIEDLLDMSKLEAGRVTLDLEAVFVEDLCRQSLDAVRELASRKGLGFVWTDDGETPELRGDPRRLRQVLINLLGNAVKFTEAGRITLSVTTRDHALRLTVADTGIGISTADQARLFEPFVQVDSRLSRRYEGTGLGLALSMRLVRLHGGTIELESTPGEGSRFTVVLPLPETVATPGT